MCLSSVAPSQTPPTPRLTLPVQYVPGAPIFIDASVNDSAPMRFILDSASSFSMIRTREAQALGLNGGRATELNGGGGSFRMTFTRAALSVGDLTLPEVQLGIAPLTERYAGIVGADLFEQFAVEIDYEGQRIRVYDPKAFRPGAAATRVPVTMIDRIPNVTATIAFGEGDEAEGTFRIDTGSWATMMLNRPFAEAHGFPPPGKPARPVGASALGGSIQTIAARVHLVRLGTIVLTEPEINAYQMDRGSGTRADSAGHIGNGLLRRFRVTIDCPGRQIVFETPLRSG
jgi:hypothetical protein